MTIENAHENSKERMIRKLVYEGCYEHVAENMIQLNNMTHEDICTELTLDWETGKYYSELE